MIEEDDYLRGDYYDEWGSITADRDYYNRKGLLKLRRIITVGGDYDNRRGLLL